MGHPAGAQIRAPLSRVVRQRDGSGQHCHVQPGSTHRPAHLVDENAKLALLDAPPKLVQHHADHPVVHIAQVTGQQLEGQTCPGSGGQQLLTHEVRVGVAGIGRIREIHLFTRQQFLQGAGLQPHHWGEPIGIGLNGRARHRIDRRVLGRRFADEAGKQVGHFLPKEHCVIKVVERLQARQDRRQNGDTTQLTRAQRLIDVQHLLGRDAHQIVKPQCRTRAITGMSAVHPVGGPLSDCVVLNAGADDIAATALFVFVVRHELRLKHLQLQGYRHGILKPPGPQANEALARLVHRPANQRLQPIEVGATVGIGFVAPVLP